MDHDADYRTVRGYQLQGRREGRLTSALEDYLEMAYRLCSENDYTRVGKLSECLNVKPSSVTKMIAKLVSLGYLQNDRYDIIRLTDSGRETGQYLLARHRTVERFLELIGSQNPLEEAELIEHSLCCSTVSDLEALIAFFEGNPAMQSSFFEFKEGRKKSE